MYRIFDIEIESEVPLPSLHTASGNSCDWRVFVSSSPTDQAGFSWFHEWTSQEGVGAVSDMACARSGEKYLLSFTGLAEFEIDFENREIHSFSPAREHELVLARLLQDQVFPRILSHQGRPVFHASSVLLPNGQGVAFLGATGRGKSTLASAFYRHGLSVLSDDSLLLEGFGEGELLKGVASYSSLRLWQDSVAQLFPQQSNFSKVVNTNGKQQWIPEQLPIRKSNSSASIAALFILGKRNDSRNSQQICIELARGNEAIMSLVESLFALDVREKSYVRRHFHWAGHLANSGTKIYALDYPRDYAKLNDVVVKVLGLLERKDRVIVE